MQASHRIQLTKLHVLLIPVFFIIHNFFDFKGLVSFSALTLPILSWLALPFILILLLSVFFKHRGNAILFASILLILFFFGAGAVKSLKQLSFISFLSRYSVSLPLLLLFISFTFIKLRRTDKRYFQLHIYLTVTFTVLILFDLVFYMPKSKEWFVKKNSFATINTPELLPASKDNTRPDIFFMIFDEHPSSASVKNLTSYDNILLDSALRNLNFHVSSAATSGFAKTRPALCSLFDMGEYPFDSVTTITFKELFSAENLLADNRLIPFLTNAGYTFINASVFRFTDHTRISLPEEWWGEAEDMIRNQTFFNRLHTDIGWLKVNYFPSLFENPVEHSIKSDVTITELVKKTIDSSLQLSPTVQKFVFVHFPLPHTPYKYDSTGTIRHRSFSEYIAVAETKEPLIEQLAFTRKFIIDLARSVQLKNRRPAIIIIQGDHGLRNYNKKKFGTGEMFKILSAVYLPGNDEAGFTDDHFAPNTFRLILNKYFNQQLSMQKPWHIQLNTVDN
jgi:hypothetical protein